MNPKDSAIATLAKLQADWLAGLLSVEEVAKLLLDLVFELGIPAAVLQGYLTEIGRKQADDIADIAEEAKLAAGAMENNAQLRAIAAQLDGKK